MSNDLWVRFRELEAKVGRLEAQVERLRALEVLIREMAQQSPKLRAAVNRFDEERETAHG